MASKETLRFAVQIVEVKLGLEFGLSDRAVQGYREQLAEMQFHLGCDYLSSSDILASWGDSLWDLGSSIDATDLGAFKALANAVSALAEDGDNQATAIHQKVFA